nr:MAG TPA: hypothetical protein [Caudoviricetes sp.]
MICQYKITLFCVISFIYLTFHNLQCIIKFKSDRKEVL